MLDVTRNMLPISLKELKKSYKDQGGGWYATDYTPILRSIGKLVASVRYREDGGWLVAVLKGRKDYMIICDRSHDLYRCKNSSDILALRTVLRNRATYETTLPNVVWQLQAWLRGTTQYDTQLVYSKLIELLKE